MGINGNKAKKIGFLTLSVIIIGYIFSPLPGIDAVSISITDPTFSSSDPIDFKILVRDDTVTFPGGITSETLLATNVIRVTTDPGASSQKVAFFDLSCKKLSGDSSVIGNCTFLGVALEPIHAGPYGSFNYGYGYGYGYGYHYGYGFLKTLPNEYGYGYGYGILGSGDYGYGLTTNPSMQDVSGLFTLSLSGSPSSIRIDVLEKIGDPDFFSSGVLTITAEEPEGADISGTKYSDENGNGIFDAGDLAFEGVPMEILVTDDFGFVLFNQIVETDGDGFYEFTNVPSGNVIVREAVDLIGFEITEPELGACPGWVGYKPK